MILALNGLPLITENRSFGAEFRVSGFDFHVMENLKHET
jgi:hypothetical protein